MFLGTWLRVSQRRLFECFWATGSEFPKECFLSVFWRVLSTRSQAPKSSQKALREALSGPGLVAQCSATPATVAATPPCSATPFQTQISVRHLPAGGGGRCDTKIFRECSATPVLHLQNAIKSRKSAATHIARHV